MLSFETVRLADGKELARQTVIDSRDTARHLDAARHPGLERGDGPARPLDEVPPEWHRGDATGHDVTCQECGTEITPDELEEAGSNVPVVASPVPIADASAGRAGPVAPFEEGAT